MLCSECYQEIELSKEIQIKGSIFCKSCVESNESIKKDVIIKCNNCSKLISNNNQVHEIHENWGDENSEKLIKCQQCYEKWLKIAKSKRKHWELMRWFNNTFLPFNMWFVLAIITVDKNKESAGRAHVLIMFILGTAIILLSPHFLDFILFIYWKVLERKYRNKKRKLKQKNMKLRK